jgi:polyhydroxyalkanoate synthesis regulator phasin
MGMKSLVMKSIYTGLGLLGSGKETVEQLGRKLAKQANVSEKDGERIARELQTRSQKAITAMQKTLHSEVNKVVSAMRAATKEMSAPPAKKRTAKRRRS